MDEIHKQKAMERIDNFDLNNIPSEMDIKKLMKLQDLKIKKLKVEIQEGKLIYKNSLNEIFELIVDAFYKQIDELMPKIRKVENSEMYNEITNNYNTCKKNALITVKNYLKSGKASRNSYKKKFKHGRVV